jgi:ligand-binding SRPBCC domain-containing protein
MGSHLKFEQWVPFSPEQVFAFFSNPENLPRTMPAASGTRLISFTRIPPPESPNGTAKDLAAGVGSTIVTSSRVIPFLPVRQHWIARITEFEWNHYFADVQDQGPFRRWHHRHEFRAEIRDGVAGTLVRDEIEYEVGFGILGEIANAW